MNPPTERRGVMSLRTVGRAFWIGLAISLALHVLFLAEGTFPRAWMDSAPELEARLEPLELESLPQPQPEGTDKAAAAPAGHEAPPQPALQPVPPPAAETPPPEAAAIPPAETPQPPPAAETEPAAPSAQPHAILAQAAQRIRSLPAHVEIVYELKGVLSGRQTHVWEQSGQRYSLEAVAQATGLTSLFVSARITQRSSGRIGQLGLMPEHYEIERGPGRKESLEFDYAGNAIESIRTDSRRGTRTLSMPLLTGAQDPLSSIYQLAMAAQSSNDGLIVAAGSKRVKGYPYRMLGTETLRTPLGEMKTLHVARAGEPSDTHLWLAPEKYSLPVRVSYTDEDGTQWVLEAVSIKATQQ